MILHGKRAAASDTTKEIIKAQFTTDKMRIRSFFGACIVYRGFVPKFAGVASPLNLMLKEDSNVYWEAPTKKQLEAFD